MKGKYKKREKGHKELVRGPCQRIYYVSIIELRKSNGTLINLLRPPHPPLSPESGGEDKGEGV